MVILTPTLRKGFTIVELIVVIAVIAILATIAMISAGTWQANMAKQTATSDLNAVKAAMDNAKNFQNSYPLTLPSTFSSSKDMTVEYKYGNTTSYCIEARSQKVPTVVYYLSTSDGAAPKEGACPAQVVAPATPVLAAVNVVGPQAQLSWNSVSGAASYDVQFRTNGGAWTTQNTAATSQTVTSLPLNASHEFQVRSRNASVASSWSSSLTRVTIAAPIISSATSTDCGNTTGSDAWVNTTLAWTNAPKSYADSYRLVGDLGASYGYTPAVFNNPTTVGTVSAWGSSTRWSANSSGAGSISLYAVGPNGEQSATTTWTSPTYGAYYC